MLNLRREKLWSLLFFGKCTHRDKFLISTI
jgi:hypothetical protein